MMHLLRFKQDVSYELHREGAKYVSLHVNLESEYQGLYHRVTSFTNLSWLHSIITQSSHMSEGPEYVKLPSDMSVLHW
jgi:hypothetical protein